MCLCYLISQYINDFSPYRTSVVKYLTAALSKSIHNLENELGVKLFDRIGNRIHLNQLEKEFAHYAE